jgi:uncharacterized protein (DUF1800 family)
MDDLLIPECVDVPPAAPNVEAPLAALLSTAMLTACGGGGSGSGGSSGVTPSNPAPPIVTPTPAPTTPPPAPLPPTPAQASRFLAQASMGATREQIARVQAVGYAAWIDEQMAMAPSTSRWDAMVAGGFNALSFKNSESGIEPAVWRKLISSPDTLRQRVALALSEIVVAAVDGFVGTGWKAFSGAAHMDTLEAHAFGNYRALLQQVSLSPPMGEYLTFRGNLKANATTGSLPDENYAREVMQLFTIGLVQLNLDGTPKMANGAPVETYGLDDIAGLARVFTGWDYDATRAETDLPDFKRKPMIQVAGRHETGSKTFLGTTIGAGVDGPTSMTQALDAIYAHDNVGPFISRQLIQRLVTSNPSPAYVARVAAAFNNNGSGVKGDLKVVLKAVLLDSDARGSATLASPTFGKQREPLLRFVAWARAFKANSPTNAWAIGNTTDPSTRLGQSPLRSPTVFNFFSPSYAPASAAMVSAGMVAPEFQITNESTVVGYLNYMQGVIRNGVGDVKADYSTLLPMVDNTQNLLDELNLVLASGQLSSATLMVMKSALDTMSITTDAAKLNKMYAALTLVLAAPEFIVVK